MGGDVARELGSLEEKDTWEYIYFNLGSGIAVLDMIIGEDSYSDTTLMGFRD